MSRLRKVLQGTVNFYHRGLRLYPQEELYKEMSFLAYYFHWSNSEVLELDHQSRRRWCREISEIHKSLGASNEKKEKSIFDLKPSR